MSTIEDLGSLEKHHSRGIMKVTSHLLIPFALLFFSSFFLSTAGNRLVFYILSPVFFYALYAAREQFLPYLRTVSFSLFAAYTGYFALSTFWSDGAGSSDYLHALRDFLCLGVFVCAFALLLEQVKGRLSTEALLILAGAAVLGVLIFAFVYYGVEGKAWEKRFRGFGRYENPIHLSFLLSFCVLFLFSLKQMARKNLESLRYGLIFLALVLMLMTQTRTSLLALAVCPAVFLLVFGQRKVALWFLGGGAAAALLALVALDFPLLELITRGDAYRFAIWRDALQSVREEHLLFGAGLATEPNLGADAYYPEGWKSTHNVYIGNLYVGGAVGLVLFLLLYGNMLWQAMKAFYAVRSCEEEKTLLSFGLLSLAFLSVAQCFNFDHYLINVYIHWLVFWVPFTIFWFFEVQSKRKKEAGLEC